MDRTNIGCFYLRTDMIVESPDTVAEIFSLMNFVPVKVEQQFARMGFYCCGMSPLFEKIEPGSDPPEYRINVEHSDTGVSKVSVQQMEY